MLFVPFYRPFLYFGGFTAGAVAGALLVLACLPGSKWTGAHAFSWRPLCILGIVSYGLYLWHFPVFVATQRYGSAIPGLPRAALAMSITALVTATSWFCIERPFLRWKAWLDRSDEPPGPSGDGSDRLVGRVAATPV